MVVGVVSPGAMGSALAATLAAGGRRVVATVAGRSERTGALARSSGVELLADFAAVVATADVLLSVVPPAESPAVAEAIATAAAAGDRRPLVVDLNAVAPATVERAAATLERAGIDLVDGSISGPPPRVAGTTRVYLSGPRAGEVSALGFTGVEVRVVGDRIGTASALKMCTASVYKGTALLLAHALVTARSHGLVAEVLDDLADSFLDLVEDCGPWLASSAAKSGRYVGEMREIAATQAGAGLPPELFEAIAAAYAAVARSPAAGLTPEQARGADDLDQVLASLIAG
jgi:3-hydroxyisobutyrate dehydrogenase-like beta-hydroxyacid dehydrogenase